MTRFLRKDLEGLTFAGKPVVFEIVPGGYLATAKGIPHNIEITFSIGSGRNKYLAKMKHIIVPGVVFFCSADSNTPRAALRHMEARANLAFKRLGEALGYEVTT